jgi:D-glycero-alpha-D-manno-heptose-7-phosphate kinase
VQLSKFLIIEGASMRDALSQIEGNHHGIVLTIDNKGTVNGLATDGDIRRRLLEGGSLDESIGSCANRTFVWETPATSRESLIKKLDHRIRFIPILDKDRRLVGVVSREHLPVQLEEAVYARSRSPVRISFGGGGSDLTHYFSELSGAVINTTISLYSHATLRVRNDSKILVSSRDLGQTLEAEDLSTALSQEGRFGLLQAILKAISPDFGFELYLHSDFPMKSGLGGSAVVSSAVLGCFNQFRRDKWDMHELAELAYQAERLHLGVAGGWQDQYATVFGGFNFMEFRMDQNIVHPLRIHPDTLLELEESLLLCDTGTTHESGDIHEDQRREMQRDDVRILVRNNVELSYRMRNLLLRGRLLEFGHALDEAWQTKRRLSSKISNTRLDAVYDGAMRNGALGGKLLGAGGGGFFLFYVPPFYKHQLMSYLEATGLKVQPFRFEKEGLRAWTVREGRNHIEMESK